MPKVDMNPTPAQPVQPRSQTQDGLHKWYYLNGEKKSYPSELKTREDQEYFLSVVKYAQYLKTPEGRKEAEINDMKEFRRLNPPSLGRKAFEVALQVGAVFFVCLFIYRETNLFRFFK